MKKNWRQWIGLIALILVVVFTLVNNNRAENQVATLDTVEQTAEDIKTSNTVVEEPPEFDEEDLIGQDATIEETENFVADSVAEDGTYTTKEEVAAYIHTYGHLPSNFITKSDAEDLGWISSKGNLQKVAPGMSIGGDKFGNREGNLPTQKGRKYYECDIDYKGGKRNAKRIVFSNDGLIFYTEDHYESFEQLY